MSTNWPNVKLAEVLRYRKDFITIDDLATYKRPRVQLHAQGIILRDEIPGALIKTKQQQVCHSGEFLVAEIDAKVGGFGIVPNSLDGAIVSSHYFLYGLDDSKLDRNFLNYFSRTPIFSDQIAAQGSTNYAAIRPVDVLSYEIPLPTLNEQRRIVARIEELAAQINEARTLRQQAVKMADSLLASKIISLFSHRLGKDWTQGKLGDYVLDDCYGTSEKTSDEETGIPILRMGNIQNGRLDLRNLKYLHIPAKDKSKLLLQHGDILVNRTNSAELVGKCAVFELDGNYSFASYLIRLRLDQEKAVPKLVAYYINSPLGRAYMVSERRQMTGQANVNSKKLKALPIQLPPLSEQKVILDELRFLQAEADEIKCVQDETTTELAVLLPSILDQAFKGEL